MNGLVLTAFRTHLVDQYGFGIWTEVHERAGEEPKLYVQAGDYDDALVSGLVDAAVEAVGCERDELLARLGRSIAPDFLTIYGIEIDSDWSAMTLVEHLDQVFERAIRRNRVVSGEAPSIACAAAGEDALRVDYRATVDRCALFEGLLLGIGDVYGEPLTVAKRECADGDGACHLLVRSPADHRRPTPRAEEPKSTVEKVGHPSI